MCGDSWKSIIGGLASKRTRGTSASSRASDPTHGEDFDVLRRAVRGLLRHVVLRGVLIVSPERFSFRDDPVPEPVLPAFTAQSDVRARRPELGPRAALVYQQLLKLGAEYVPELSSRYLAMDADVVFLRRTTSRGRRGARTWHVAQRLVGELVAR